MESDLVETPPWIPLPVPTGRLLLEKGLPPSVTRLDATSSRQGSVDIYLLEWRPRLVASQDPSCPSASAASGRGTSKAMVAGLPLHAPWP